MKILVHDYAGHPCQIELSRELARRGHRVIHAYFSGDPGPKGQLIRQSGDSPHLSFVGVGARRPYDKTSLVRRRFDDVAYGQRAHRLIVTEKPDVVISGNTPTEAQGLIAKGCHAAKAAFVFWMQDVYSIAASHILRSKFGPLGTAIGLYYRHLERRLLQRSHAIVTISEDFAPLAAAWSGAAAKVFTIENWGAAQTIRPGPKDNAWSRAHGLHDGFNFLYAGTLGLKHDPELLIALARHTIGRARVVVVSAGSGVQSLLAARDREKLDNLIVLPLQPFSCFGDVLATADVAVAMIEPAAGSFSVPSKVQSYFCAGRPILLSAPASNLAARLVARENAGLVVSPTERDAFLAAAMRLANVRPFAASCADNSRAFAAGAFDIGAITDRFLDVIHHAVSASGRGASPVRS